MSIESFVGVTIHLSFFLKKKNRLQCLVLLLAATNLNMIANISAMVLCAEQFVTPELV